MAEKLLHPDDLAPVFLESEIEEEIDESAKMMESNAYLRKLMEHLNGQRTNKEYCGFTIHVGDKEFPVHQNILAARSEYFNVMFTSKMTESLEKQVVMKDISEDCMKWILDFLYSGKIEFSLKNIEEIIESAALMQIQELLDLATEYVVQVLSPQNCLHFFQIGKLHLMDDLENAANKYLMSHFDKVAQQEWFVNLDFQDLEMFLSSQDVVVINEEKVYEALMRWLIHDFDSRKKYFPTLFQHIRLSALPIKYIEDVIRKDEIFLEYPNCYEKIVRHYFLVGSSTNIEANPRKGLLSNENTGFITNDEFNDIEIHPLENKFQLHKVKSNCSSIDYSCVHGNKGYICHRFNLYCYNGKTWEKIGQLSSEFQCQYMIYTDLNGVPSIYLLGKKVSNVLENQFYNQQTYRTSTTYEIQKFNLESKQIKQAKTCFMPWRTGASVVALGDKMYIMGGYLYRQGWSNIKTACDLVDILNLNEDVSSWEIGQNLNIPRANFASAQLRSRIYSFGGFGKNNELLTSGEFMDLSDGVRNKLTNDVPLPLGSASAFCVGDHIAVYEKGKTLEKIFLFNYFNEDWVMLKQEE